MGTRGPIALVLGLVACGAAGAAQGDPAAGQRARPQAIAVKRLPRDQAAQVSALRNGDLERVVLTRRGAPAAASAGLHGASRGFAGAQAWELGYEVAASEAHSGRRSARCANDDEQQERGLRFVVKLNQQRASPIRAECWSKARSVSGARDAGYSLYLDIIFTDGTPSWGHIRSFATGTHGWEKAVVTFAPEKPIREVRVHGLLRGHRGTAWFDDFALFELRPKGKWSVFDGVLVEQRADAAAAGRAPARPARSLRTQRAAGPAAPDPPAPESAVTVTGGAVSLALEVGSGRIVRVGRRLREGRSGGLLVRDVAADSDFRQPLGAVTATPEGAHFSGEDPDLGLELQADYVGQPDRLSVRGTVQNLSGREPGAGRDRAVTVYLAVPLEAVGWRWGQGLRADLPIGADRDYQVTVPVAVGTGTMARYPLAAVWNASDGWAIACPVSLPRVNRVGYNAASRELYAAVDLGLSGDTARFPHQASFEFLLYRFDPAWGMRAALQHYYEVFPGDFVKRVEREGIWMPFTDISTVQSWQDFGFAFKEGANDVPFDSAHGIYSFVYVEPATHWMTMPADMPRTRQAADALLAEKAAAAPDSSYAAATYSSVIYDANGEWVTQFVDAPWANGALYLLNPAPSVPVTQPYPVNKAQAMFDTIDEAIAGARWPLTEWRPWDRGYAVQPGAGPRGAAALSCENASGQSSGAMQTVDLSPPRQERIAARAWSKAENVSGQLDADYSLYLDLQYADGTPGYGFIKPFATGTHDWEMVEVDVDAPKPVAQVRFHLLLRAPRTGRAWFAEPELTVGGGPNLLANPAFAPSGGPPPAVSGTYVDSVELGSEFLNYRREHWRDATIPLVFDPASGQAAQALMFGTCEFLQACAGRMRAQGRLMFANSALWHYDQVAPLLDVLGTETNWLRDGELHPESDEVMMLRRALCYQKPYCLLMNSNYDQFPHDYTERYFRRCLFYAIFPSFFSHNGADNPYWGNLALYNRDRDLFKRYIPVIQQIAHAGWEPVTHARSDDPVVYVERYGPREGLVYLTLLNAGETLKRARVTVDLAALGVNAAIAVEVMTGREVRLEGAGFVAELQPEEVWVVRIGSPAQTAGRVQPWLRASDAARPPPAAGFPLM